MFRRSMSTRVLMGAVIPAAAAISMIHAGAGTAGAASTNCVASAFGTPSSTKANEFIAYRYCANPNFNGFLQITTPDGKTTSSPVSTDPAQALKVYVSTKGLVCAKAWEISKAGFQTRGQSCLNNG